MRHLCVPRQHSAPAITLREVSFERVQSGRVGLTRPPRGQNPITEHDQHALRGNGPIDPGAATPGAPTLQPESTLRDALSTMLSSSVQLGVVVDERERVVGLVSVDAISEALRAPVAPVEPVGQASA